MNLTQPCVKLNEPSFCHWANQFKAEEEEWREEAAEEEKGENQHGHRAWFCPFMVKNEDRGMAASGSAVGSKGQRKGGEAVRKGSDGEQETYQGEYELEEWDLKCGSCRLYEKRG